MSMLQRLSVVCTLLAFVLAAPAPISPSRSGKWLLSHPRKASLAAKSLLSRYITRSRWNIIKSLVKRDLPGSVAIIPDHQSLYAFRQFSPRERKMTSPSAAVVAGRLADQYNTHLKTASQTKFPGLDAAASITNPRLQNTLTLNSKIGQYTARKAAPMETSNGFVRFVRKSLSTADQVGLTGGRCTSSPECADGRVCTNGEITTCPAGDDCFCAPSDGPKPCTSSADCATAGEVCAQLTGGAACLSEEVANAQKIPIVSGESSSDEGDTATSDDTDSHTGSGDGITGAPCTSSSECAEGRICNGPDASLCSAGERCICVPSDGPELCTSSADCSTDGEVCVQLDDAICFSKNTANVASLPIVGGESSSDGSEENAGSTPTPDESDDPSSSSESDGNDEEACIDARALGHLPSDALVFKKHAVSRVLCDENNSCATRGHMVLFHGHAMRMSTYCDSVGCKQAVVEVNSPRFSRGMRIESNTKELEYTVFAARHDTRAEESMIRIAVQLGL
ncbi:unnamed protein product [Chondrus crispus]|uniref:EGF-like domain-containing protein n=1 Tax=Chondrus crispus TaxID=2769 RepID=R7QLH8_CHOCR|nr:unnamed protein product [Chondrus crispus]CDF38326.1 unnamed protein product [Chondrus crispus]|eukprot:XP_005718211.1 unnamed protein product [Chondrus crispus]